MLNLLDMTGRLRAHVAGLVPPQKKIAGHSPEMLGQVIVLAVQPTIQRLTDRIAVLEKTVATMQRGQR